ncbi:hypothetical protein FQN49_004064 [Arthroderma sp. PD_2]|nr:hypothetical protein FQN49_004064 [Arthroderma sp. PD_2]
MSSTDYNYDEQGQFFPFFILTLTGLVTLPLTYTLLKPVKGLENSAPRIKSDFKPQNDDIIQSQKQKLLRKERRIKRIITVIVGYAVMAWMVYLIMVTARSAPKIWDPYEILGISRSADERAISKHYKRLSVKFHPDKIKPDPAKNETVEMLNDHFVELTKAYKTLTDEEIRNNYIQFGHPDGKQSFSIGIALPKFIVTEGNGKFVLLLYGILFGVLLPYTVGKWWYGNQRYTKDSVLVPSAGSLFREYKPDLSDGDMISTLSVGDEYTELLKDGHEGLAKVEEKILDLMSLSPKEKLALSKLDDEKRRKALALLWAYLGRIDLEDNELNNEKFQVAPPAVTLNNAFTTIALAFGNLQPIMTSLYTSQNLIQAVPPKSSPLLQLPYFNANVVRSVDGEHSKSHMTVQQFMRLPEANRRSMSIGPGLLTESEYKTAVSVARRIPALQLCKAVLRVPGERAITPSSLVQLVVKARFVPPGCEYVPPVKESDLEIDDIDEDALADAQTGNAELDPKEKEKKKQSEKEDEAEVQPPLAHAPYLARDHSPRWHIFLADVKQDRMAVPPFTFTTFDKPIFDDEGKPTFNVQTMKMQFQAPPQVGSFPFVLNIVCDSYIGFDEEQEITLEVEDLEKAEAVAAEDDISEPDEDSIAGQMQALKTGQAPPPRKKRVVDSSEEDESDTDGEAADDTSETDTDTDSDGE